MKFDISKSVKQGHHYFIARDSAGTVRYRANTLAKLHEAIKTYSPPAKIELKEGIEAEKKSIEETEQQEVETNPIIQPVSEEKKEFLQSETKEIIETKRKSSGKKTFWDKLK